MRKVMLKLIFVLLCFYDHRLSRRQVLSGAGVPCAGGVCAGYGAKTVWRSERPVTRRLRPQTAHLHRVIAPS